LPDGVEEDLLLKVVDQAKVPDSGGKSLTTPAKGGMEGWVDLDYKQSGKN
jgi:hypothetical protein